VRLSQESDSKMRVTRVGSPSCSMVNRSRYCPLIHSTVPFASQRPVEEAGPVVAGSKRRTLDPSTSPEGHVAGAVQRTTTIGRSAAVALRETGTITAIAPAAAHHRRNRAAFVSCARPARTGSLEL
jgi:hypothetical protein